MVIDRYVGFESKFPGTLNLKNKTHLADLAEATSPYSNYLKLKSYV